MGGIQNFVGIWKKDFGQKKFFFMKNSKRIAMFGYFCLLFWPVFTKNHKCKLIYLKWQNVT